MTKKRCIKFISMGVLLIAGIVRAKPVSVDAGEDITEQPGVWILDVRSAEEYASGHLRGAHQIPVQNLEARRSELPPNKETLIFVYCRSGRRSAQADQYLTEQGYNRVYSLEGGLNAWEAGGKRTVKSGP